MSKRSRKYFGNVTVKDKMKKKLKKGKQQKTKVKTSFFPTLNTSKTANVTSNKIKKNKKNITIQKSKDLKNAPIVNSKSRKDDKTVSLRERMLNKLKSARFRFINEELYTSDSQNSKQLFQKDPEAFRAYHDGYRHQVEQWPINPLAKIIKSIKKLPADYVVADFGCGEAKLSKSIPQKVHSFDLVALNQEVTVCDMANCPLESNSVNVAVYCLSLMGTNLNDYLIEANRVLKMEGLLKIADVESRFDNADKFITKVEKFGFKNISNDFKNNMFYFFDFKKTSYLKNTNTLPILTLKPCMYKKR